MINQLHAHFHRPEKGRDSVPSAHSSRYAAGEWSSGVRRRAALHDGLDSWVGGLRFYVAKPGKSFDFYREGGFQLETIRTCGGGLGCNEFVFSRGTE